MRAVAICRTAFGAVLTWFGFIAETVCRFHTRLLCRKDMNTRLRTGDSAQRFAIVVCFRPRHGDFRDVARITPNPPMAAPFRGLYTAYRRVTRCHRVGPIDYPAPGVGAPVRLPRGTISGDYVKVYGLTCRAPYALRLAACGRPCVWRGLAWLLAPGRVLLPLVRRGGVYGSRIRIKYSKPWNPCG